MSAAQEALQKEAQAMRAIQQDLQKIVPTRTQLEAQYKENKAVIDELDVLDEDANVFKLVGPALIKQDLVEAKANVNKRIEYIKSEMDRLDGQIKSLETKLLDKERDLIKAQKKLQGQSS